MKLEVNACFFCCFLCGGLCVLCVGGCCGGCVCGRVRRRRAGAAAARRRLRLSPACGASARVPRLGSGLSETISVAVTSLRAASCGAADAVCGARGAPRRYRVARARPVPPAAVPRRRSGGALVPALGGRRAQGRARLGGGRLVERLAPGAPRRLRAGRARGAGFARIAAFPQPLRKSPSRSGREWRSELLARSSAAVYSLTHTAHGNEGPMRIPTAAAPIPAQSANLAAQPAGT